MIKQNSKRLMVWLLGKQIKRLVFKNPNLRIVAVSGSVGKTSTKLAIAHVLSGNFRVRFQDGNYNDLVSVPLIFFGHKVPRVWNVLAWVWILIKDELAIHSEYPYDVVIIELGLCTPGVLPRFGNYLNPDITVITSVAAEHMEFFESLEAVAEEEMSVIRYSKQVLINISDIDEKYRPKDNKIMAYGLTKLAENRAAVGPLDKKLNRPILIELKDKKPITVDLPSPSKNMAKSALAAAVVAGLCQVDMKEIKKRLENLSPIAGRVQVLRGINDSLLLDDTYNSSPSALRSALKLLYEIDAPQHIAILGSMNELGDYSQSAHEDIGTFCDPKKLDIVVTIGHDAYRFLALAAQSAGCKVERFLNPVAAGYYVSEVIKKGAVVLAKGSQNGVFAEEALKYLLADPEDSKKLVRQSRSWIRTKRQQFPDVRR